ncbi:DUF6484 domain-containing protein [Corallococcus sp. BB11-1]|uniref:DUF6484 domain-containing protein n=1 Tax=Corallococcus sp. BB11-1 TaxID=2996783 RepID=UPI00226EF3FE|nr:DUF6484 domain-containing protein [Corallococcus sp. BB11-1]MCY1034024.1 DUF6484 domain-containing protein [Corallococcus sp. BB11-1]
MAPVKPEGNRSDAPPDVEERIIEPRTGWLVGFEAGRILVDFPGNHRGPLPARTAVALEPGVLAHAAAQRQEAVLLFAGGDPSRPLLMGLLQPERLTPLIDALLDTPPAAPKEVHLDGRRVVLEGREEVVLRCGKASLTLRRNGQVVLRGVNIRTEADEVQRIKGGKVQIN